MINPIIEVKNLKKTYKDTPVLNGVDFFVKPGKIFALLGSNCAGKTTTVRILATLLSHEGGTATIGGYDVVAQAQKVREMIKAYGRFRAG